MFGSLVRIDKNIRGDSGNGDAGIKRVAAFTLSGEGSLVTQCNRFDDLFRQPPLLQHITTKLRVIELKLLLLKGCDGDMVNLPGSYRPVQIRPDSVQPHHSDILQKTRKKQCFRIGLTCLLADDFGCNCRYQTALPQVDRVQAAVITSPAAVQ